MDAVRSPWIIAFGVVTVVHLSLLAADAGPWDSITKCLLAPLLLAWVVQLQGPRLLMVALIGCFFGDLFLELDEAWFPVGMAAFAVAHVCWIVFFVQRGAGDRLKRAPWIPALFALGGAALIAWCWSGLPDDIRPLVPFYAALLAGTAMTAVIVDERAGIGGISFLISDGLIAASKAHRVDAEADAVRLAIMVLYIAAIVLLSTGILAKEKRSLAAAGDGGLDPRVRTDCWPRLP